MAHVLELTVKDAGGSNRDVATLDAVMALLGEVQASPTANTALDRLKALNTSLGAIVTLLEGTIAVDTDVSALALESGGNLDAIAAALAATLTVDTGLDLSALALEDGGNLAALVARLGEVQASPTANTVLDRLKALLTGIVLAAGSNLIGKVSAGLDSSTLYNGATALTPKYLPIAASSSGANNLLSAVTGKKIRVLAYTLMGNGAVNAKFQQDAGGTPADISGLKYIAAAGGGISVAYNPHGWFETAADKTLDLDLSAAVAVGGELVYVEV